MQNPLWMGAIEIRIDLHHLAFKPESKFDTAGIDILNNLRKTVRPNCRINDPITQSSAIIAAKVEPAIVENHAFYTNFSSNISERLDLFNIVIEVDRLPDIER